MAMTTTFDAGPKMLSLRPGVCSRWAAQRQIARLPDIQLARQANYYMTNTSPNPDWTATISTSAGVRVGTATYAVTPLDDQLWLYGLEIAPAHRRQGYALATLWQLHQEHRLPIHPVHELGTAGGFWQCARRLASTGLQVAEALSLADLEEAKKRWGHLAPAHERLQREIRARLAAGEDWYRAIGRGLDA